MGKVIMSGVSKGMTVPAVFSDNFADNTWEQIILACETNTVPDTWEVGDQKVMTFNEPGDTGEIEPHDYVIDIIGKNHDTYTAGGTAPLTFQLNQCHRTKSGMNISSATNAGGWKSCELRTSVLAVTIAYMPSEVNSRIKEVNKLTSAGSQSSTIETTADKLFLLSEVEVFGTVTNSRTGEGSQYAYYAAGNSKVKSPDANLAAWWLRSPNASRDDQFCRVSNAGATNSASATSASGVSFAFCF